MKAIDSLRKEFQSVLKNTGLIYNKTSNYNAYSYDESLVRAVICSGLYPGVCSVMYKDNSLSLKKQWKMVRCFYIRNPLMHVILKYHTHG
ncbi:hypothetical protein QVD17_03443 [Tagetes erecta]|uniref:Uncharacterized protein n=1 Tax=Tagetes erecta TaxID=13708 RepID=A0AAD8LBA8_TARER|nr:hypothetical protein QVD17_03443 [Tagetes erecta]